MITPKYTLSVLLYILLLPISTPAAFIVSTWTRPDDLGKIKGDKFDEVGELGARVITINPFDTYGDD